MLTVVYDKSFKNSSPLNMTNMRLSFLSVVLFSASCGNHDIPAEQLVGQSSEASKEPSSGPVGQETRPDCRETIKAIAGKHFIPVDESKSDLLFTLNQNLNLELINYGGSYEGTYTDNLIQFDDKNATVIGFELKGSNVVLRNKNGIEIEFREATDADLLSGTWYYGLDLYKNGARMIFDKSGNWKRPDDMMGSSHGSSKNKGEGKFSILHFMNRDDLPTTLTMVDGRHFYLNWDNAFGTTRDDHVRAQKSKPSSLNQIFN